jgi:23S rRNA (cytidine1920-2'-O)/16S rRNA (cytidine1409-2'-O)-methyltransferase
LKLDAALDRFGVEVAGRRAIDVGASTGGFTDCLLQRGATCVVAIDVGYGQLHERLRADERVRSLERTNVREVDVAAIGGPAPVVVVDVSFISLRTIGSALVALMEPDGDLVALVKPQFEATRLETSRGRGVVRDPVVWRRVLDETRNALGSLGTAMMGVMVSPITGASGNVEFLVHARRGGAECGDATLDAVVAEAKALRA